MRLLFFENVRRHYLSFLSYQKLPGANPAVFIFWIYSYQYVQTGAIESFLLSSLWNSPAHSNPFLARRRNGQESSFDAYVSATAYSKPYYFNNDQQKNAPYNDNWYCIIPPFRFAFFPHPLGVSFASRPNLLGN